MNTRKYGLVGVCNAIVDIYVHLSDQELTALGFDKSSYSMLSREDQLKLLEKFSSHSLPKMNGGSVANSVVTYGELAGALGGTIGNGDIGGSAAMITCLGSDALGEFYRSESARAGVSILSPAHADEPTGTCVVFVTPDAERTMRTYLGAALHLDSGAVDERVINESAWVFLEGYVLSSPLHGDSVARAVVAAAKSADTPVAFTCSDGWVVDAHRATVTAVLPDVECLFANEVEVQTLTGTNSREDALRAVGDLVPLAAITLGEDGAVVVRKGEITARVPAVSCKPVDLTGAGDSFAGTFLWAISRGLDDSKAASLGCAVAAAVISRQGARLPHGEVSRLVAPHFS